MAATAFWSTAMACGSRAVYDCCAKSEMGRTKRNCSDATAKHRRIDTSPTINERCLSKVERNSCRILIVTQENKWRGPGTLGMHGHHTFVTEVEKHICKTEICCLYYNRSEEHT